MAKRITFAPGILLTIPDPSPTTVVGGGTGQSTTDTYACSYNDWLVMFADDLDDDDEYTMNDYMLWWDAQGFDMDAWKTFNGDTPFEPNPGGI